jgi:ubiquinone/menaquinone biosynthesis C-methylase UbiE/DNA-binding transcriptional ArsR family regulator
VNSTSALLKLLGDPVRLRLLRVLSLQALNVSELTAVLDLAQSGVSRHLGLLKKADLVVEERRGNFTWHRLSPDSEMPGHPAAPLWAWLQAEFKLVTPATRADDARLEEVRRLRKESFIEHGDGAERRQHVPGRSWAAWSRALGLLLPPLAVADLGCGEGYLTIEVARWARRVTAVDRSAAALARARALAERRGVKNIVWKRGTLEQLPLDNASVDVALLSQALHHADPPDAAVGEAWRVLRPGGRLLVLDLRNHDQGWVRTTLGDKWLGFTDRRLRQLITTAGFGEVVVRVGARRSADPFTVLVASGTKPTRRVNHQAAGGVSPTRDTRRRMPSTEHRGHA